MDAGLVLPRRPSQPDVTTIPTPPQQAAAIFIVFFFTLFALFMFLLRIWTRVKVTRQWGLDIKLAYFGWRQQDVPADYDPSAGLWWFFISQIFYNPILAFVKCSVLVFMLRIGGQKDGVRRAVYGLIIFTILQAIAIFFGVLLQCVPIEANWDPVVKEHAKCINNAFHITISTITIVTDIAVLALPFYVFLGLNMRKAAKIGLIGVFMLGGVVTIVAIVRVVTLIQLFYFPETLGDPFYDIKMTLSVVEVNVAIAGACAPALRPLFVIMSPALFGSTGDELGGNNGRTSYGDSKLTMTTRTHKRLASNQSYHQPHDQEPPVPSKSSIAMQAIRNNFNRNRHPAEVPGTSPTGSEVDMVGIMRTMDVEVQYHAITDDTVARWSTSTLEKVVQGSNTKPGVSRSESRSESRADSRSDSRSQSRSQSRSDSRSDTRRASRSDFSYTRKSSR